MTPTVQALPERLHHGGRLRAAAARYGIALEHWLDLSTGINPKGWPVPPIPAWVWSRLPEDEDGLEAAARAYYGADHLLPLAGSQAAIQALPRLRPPCQVRILAPSYAEHAAAWRQAGHQVEDLGAEDLGGIDFAVTPLREPASQARHLPAAIRGLDPACNVLVLIHPNNPTGARFPLDRLLDWHRQLAAREGWLVIDEAFMDLTPEQSLCPLTGRPGLIVLRSLGKFFGLAGVRLGFACAWPELLQDLHRLLGPWTVNAPGRWLAKAALADGDWQAATRRELTAASDRLGALLCRHGLEPSGGGGLFQWVLDPQARQRHEALARQGILTRLFEAPLSLRLGLPGREADWARLDQALSRSGRGVGKPPRARALMVQGTTSDAGKSLLVTALGRWLARRGIAVAPFKPQNMALNSAVTHDGGEIGRAQAVQALACGLQPHTDMNPVLLKPNTDTGAQVIIQGRAVATMNARDYQGYKAQARQAVLASFHRLAAGYQVILVEGAGSPAEVNLRAQDIANMGFAEAVDCPVILIADIDRGGVFAHLVGTLALLSERERARVQGFVINRFRGDLDLLRPGLEWLERETGKPVLGVLPFLPGLHLEAEDGLASPPQRQVSDSEDAGPASLRIIVPALPRLSNRTDFDPLCLHPQVALSFIGPGQDLPPADLIILPGSKSVRSDLAWLRQQGWEAAILRHLRYGGKVIGLCGGFQMLGRRIHDPQGLEGAPGSSEGLGLLDLETTLAPEKQLRNVQGQLSLGQEPVTGYEIHAGVSEGPALGRPALHLRQDPDLGPASLKDDTRREIGGNFRVETRGALGEGRSCEPGGELRVAPRGARVGSTKAELREQLRVEPGDETQPETLGNPATLGPDGFLNPEGAISPDGQVLGTYVHGLFESPAATTALLAWAGLPQAERLDYHRLREATFERLADTLDQHLDATWLRTLAEGPEEGSGPNRDPLGKSPSLAGAEALGGVVMLGDAVAESDEGGARASGDRRSLILGGTRSGKSRLAERLARESGLGVTYIATATAGDGDMAARIAAHRARRPAQWQLVEEPLHLAATLTARAAPGHCLLVDCLTLWLTNLLLAEDQDLLSRETQALLTLIPQLPGRLLLVSNETGLGIMPLGDLSRRFGDAAGTLHQDLAHRCDDVILAIAGQPVVLKGEPLPDLTASFAKTEE